MKRTGNEELQRIYPACRSVLGSHTWKRIINACTDDLDPGKFSDILSYYLNDPGVLGFIPELARLEWALFWLKNSNIRLPAEVGAWVTNPTLQVLRLSWKNLLFLLSPEKEGKKEEPVLEEEIVLLWIDPKSMTPRTGIASNEDLLALKIVVEGIDPDDAAREGNLTVGAVYNLLFRAGKKGILRPPKSLIRRDPETFPKGSDIDEQFFSSPVFTLQWHITQVCDLRCKHCYDRSDISPLGLDQAMGILDDMRSFCRSRNVSGHISFTGGNPLLYPNFIELYRAASERGFSLAVLGNPAPRREIEEIMEVEKPGFFQVSLEGLPEHNDFIRGEGHFRKVMDFLTVLKELGICSMVMLTLTRDNMDQVLPLAEVLRVKADVFTFNRLSLVGEGANLAPSEKGRYADFLDAYMKAAEQNPIMGLKDNLINILLRRKGSKPFGGCAGYGCGAAFNFMTVLPDGEAHACRKFPSPLGNVLGEGIAGVYESERAEQYRAGCRACASCRIRPVCGGCLAVTHSFGLNVFEERDPYCFIDTAY
ncbi:MAG: thio(seleno)oxazole modification radical SAM maturase SbtM [bacterium]